MSTSLGVNFGSSLSTVMTVYLTDPNGLALLVTSNTTPETTQAATYQKGCLCIRTDNGTLYSMTGTSASPSWTLNSNSAITGPTGVTGVTGPTGPTGPQGTAA